MNLSQVTEIPQVWRSKNYPKKVVVVERVDVIFATMTNDDGAHIHDSGSMTVGELDLFLNDYEPQPDWATAEPRPSITAQKLT